MDGEGGESEDATVEWALLEGATRDAPPVLLGAPRRLLVSAGDESRGEPSDDASLGGVSGDDGAEALKIRAPSALVADGGSSLLPRLTSELTGVRLPASQLQKAMRRGFCSPAPLLEACVKLLCGAAAAGERATPPRGGPFAMFSTIWACMLVDASPFDAAPDGSTLGLQQLLALSLVARADPGWAPPPQLARKAVAAALRTQQRPCNQWLGFMERDWAPNMSGWCLESEDGSSSPPGEVDGDDSEDESERGHQDQGTPTERLRALELRNTLVATQAAVGSAIRWGRWDKFEGEPTGAALIAYLNCHFTEWFRDGRLQAEAVKDEAALLSGFDARLVTHPPDARLLGLDFECRLAAWDPQVQPASLLLLQAALSEPPTSWKKHALPSLAKQVRQLISEALRPSASVTSFTSVTSVTPVASLPSAGAEAHLGGQPANAGAAAARTARDVGRQRRRWQGHWQRPVERWQGDQGRWSHCSWWCDAVTAVHVGTRRGDTDGAHVSEGEGGRRLLRSSATLAASSAG